MSPISPFVCLSVCRDVMSLGISLVGHQKKIMSSIQTMRAQMLHLHGKGVQVWRRTGAELPKANQSTSRTVPAAKPEEMRRKLKDGMFGVGLFRQDKPVSFCSSAEGVAMCWCYWRWRSRQGHRSGRFGGKRGGTSKRVKKDKVATSRKTTWTRRRTSSTTYQNGVTASFFFFPRWFLVQPCAFSCYKYLKKKKEKDKKISSLDFFACLQFFPNFFLLWLHCSCCCSFSFKSYTLWFVSLRLDSTTG